MAFENFHKQCAKPRPHYVWLRDKKAPFLRAQLCPHDYNTTATRLKAAGISKKLKFATFELWSLESSTMEIRFSKVQPFHARFD